MCRLKRRLPELLSLGRCVRAVVAAAFPGGRGRACARGRRSPFFSWWTSAPTEAQGALVNDGGAVTSENKHQHRKTSHDFRFTFSLTINVQIRELPHAPLPLARDCSHVADAGSQKEGRAALARALGGPRPTITPRSLWRAPPSAALPWLFPPELHPPNDGSSVSRYDQT